MPASQQHKQSMSYPSYHEGDTDLDRQTFDISGKFPIEIVELLERSFDIAEKHRHREVSPEILIKTIFETPDIVTRAKQMLGDLKIPKITNQAQNSDIVVLSTNVKRLLLLSYLISQKYGRSSVELEDLLLSYLQLPETKVLFPEIDTREAERQIVSKNGNNNNMSFGSSNTPVLNKYTVDLTQMAANGKLEDVIGREDEIQRVIQILTRQTKSNAVLLGEAGVGKTAIVEGIAMMINDSTVPDVLAGVRILSLNLVGLISNINSVGRAENLMESILDEIKSNGNIILFIDELHTITGGGNTNEANSMSNILKPALARGEVHMIGATTLTEYRKYIEKDPALSRRFEPVKVEEPDIETAIKILTKVAQKLEKFHKVEITDEAIKSSVVLSKRYIQDRHLPDKAIDLLDEAASKAALKGLPSLHEEDIRDIISDRTGIPINSISVDDKQKLVELEDTLSKSVIGQAHAVHVVSEAIRRTRAGLKDPNKPTGSFLFLGPSGVGKTELAKVLTREIYNTEKALIRLDMSEFSEQHTVQRLIGAPPGYVGYDEGGQLTNPVWDRPYSLILLDEIEKAHPKVFDIFLQVLDDGRLTDGQGRTVDFKNTIIIATSNIAAKEIMQVINGVEDAKLLSDPDFIQETIIPILRDYFRPEFINRFDEVVLFNPLGETELMAIGRLVINKIEGRLKEKNIRISVSDETLASYAKEAYNPDFGARPLKRIIQDRIENQIARDIINSKLKEGGEFKI